MPRPDSGAAEGVVRHAVLAAALQLLDESGVDGLSMRALAERLGIKAASLYWHFRDKEQLLEELVASVLEEVPVPTSLPWREGVAAACEALAQILARHPAAAELVLRNLGVVLRSSLVQRLAGLLGRAGLAGAETAATALVVETAAAAAAATVRPVRPAATTPLRLEVDSGAWRVNVRAGGQGMSDVALGVGSSPPYVEPRPDGRVLVRNWRGGNRGAVELNPWYAWSVKVHSGAWNALLDLSGLRVTAVDLDSGSGKLTCLLPVPSGIVPVTINSGILGVTLHRPPGTAVRALVHTGCFRVRFDDTPVRTSSADVIWSSASPPVADTHDRYEVTVHSGSMNVTMDATATPRPVPRPAPPPTAGPDGGQAPAVDAVRLMLDGIERRIAGATAADQSGA